MSKKFANLAHYIRENLPNIYQLVEDLDLIKRLSSSSSRITLLTPDDKTLKSIEAQAKSDPAEASKALANFFIFGIYCKPSDFGGADGINTIARKSLKVKETSKDSVTLEPDAVVTFTKQSCNSYFPAFYAKPDAGFAVLSVSGVPHVDDTRIPLRKKEESVKGSSEQELIQIRQILASQLSEFQHKLRSSVKDASDYLMTRLLIVINQAILKEDNLFLALARSVATCHACSSYFLILYNEKLFEYHRLSANLLQYLSAEGPITKTWEDFATYPLPQDGLLLKEPRDLLDHRDIARKNACEYTKPEIFVPYVRGLYDKLEAHNTIEGSGPVYPAEYINFLRANKGILYVMNEIAFVLKKAFCYQDSASVERVVNNVVTCFLPSLREGVNALSVIDMKNAIVAAYDFLCQLVKEYFLPFLVPASLKRGGDDEDDDFYDLPNIEGGDNEFTSSLKPVPHEILDRLEEIKALHSEGADITDKLNDFIDYIRKMM